MRTVLLDAKQGPGPFLVLSGVLCGGLSYFLFSAAPIDAFANVYYSARFNQVLPLAVFFPFAHLASFTLLSALLSQAAGPRRRISLGLGLVGLAIGSELIQVFLAHRSVQSIDLIANLAGICCGFSLVSRVRSPAHILAALFAAGCVPSPPNTPGIPSSKRGSTELAEVLASDENDSPGSTQDF